MTQKSWQILLYSAIQTEAYEINCLECFDLLDQYAEFLLDGGNPDEIMPAVRQHLGQCDCCTHEFEALMTILQQATTSGQSSVL